MTSPVTLPGASLPNEIVPLLTRILPLWISCQHWIKVREDLKLSLDKGCLPKEKPPNALGTPTRLSHKYGRKSLMRIIYKWETLIYITGAEPIAWRAYRILGLSGRDRIRCDGRLDCEPIPNAETNGQIPHPRQTGCIHAEPSGLFIWSGPISICAMMEPSANTLLSSRASSRVWNRYIVKTSSCDPIFSPAVRHNWLLLTKNYSLRNFPLHCGPLGMFGGENGVPFFARLPRRNPRLP